MTEVVTKTPDEIESAKNLTLGIYVMYLAAFFLPFLSIIAIIINYVKRSSVKGTYLESHFRWQIRTFWFSLLFSIIGIVLVFIIIGYFILIGVVIWMLYRNIRGLIALNDKKPMYA